MRHEIDYCTECEKIVRVFSIENGNAHLSCGHTVETKRNDKYIFVERKDIHKYLTGPQYTEDEFYGYLNEIFFRKMSEAERSNKIESEFDHEHLDKFYYCPVCMQYQYQKSERN